MLQSIRKQAKGFLALILFGLLILSFAAWGIGDIFRGGGDVAPVAVVGDYEVTLEEFNVALQREMRRLQPVFGGRLDIEQARQFGVFDSVVQRLVARTLLGLAAADTGVTVSDGLVGASIRANRIFHNELGDFDQGRFEEILFNNGLNESRYVQQLRADMARSQLVDSITAGLAVPGTMLEPIYQYREERRVAEVLTVSRDKFFDVREPDTAELDTFHRENADRFMAPEYRAVTAVVLTADSLAKDIHVPEDHLREEYEIRLDEFETKETRKLEQILTLDETDARRAYDLLRQGRAFDAVAQEVSGQAPVAIGPVGHGILAAQEPTLADAVFALTAGEISEPVHTPFGWHVVRVLEINPGRLLTFEEAREDLASDIAADRAIDDLFQLANELEDELGGGSSLESAAAGLNLELLKVPAVDAAGLGRDGNTLSELPTGDQFLRVAFEMVEGEDSQLTEFGTDGYFILRVDSVTQATLRPLDTIRETVVEAWRVARRQEAAEAQATELLNRAKAGAVFTALAAEADLPVTTTPPLTRTGETDEGSVAPALAAQLFGALTGEAVMAPVPEGYAVARLRRIIRANYVTDETVANELRRQLREGVSGDLLNQFGSALRERFGVEVFPRAFDRLL